MEIQLINIDLWLEGATIWHTASAIRILTGDSDRPITLCYWHVGTTVHVVIKTGKVIMGNCPSNVTPTNIRRELWGAGLQVVW